MPANLADVHQTFDLDILRYNVGQFLAREIDLAPGGLEFISREMPEMMGRQLLGVLRVPGQVLQNNRMIHQHPATLWDHIKQRVAAHFPGLKRWLPVNYLEVRLTEHLVYPTLSVPSPYADKVRLFVEPSFTTVLQ